MYIYTNTYTHILGSPVQEGFPLKALYTPHSGIPWRKSDPAHYLTSMAFLMPLTFYRPATPALSSQHQVPLLACSVAWLLWAITAITFGYLDGWRWKNIFQANSFPTGHHFSWHFYLEPLVGEGSHLWYIFLFVFIQSTGILFNDTALLSGYRHFIFTCIVWLQPLSGSFLHQTAWFSIFSTLLLAPSSYYKAD